MSRTGFVDKILENGSLQVRETKVKDDTRSEEIEEIPNPKSGSGPSRKGTMSVEREGGNTPIEIKEEEMDGGWVSILQILYYASLTVAF